MFGCTGGWGPERAEWVELLGGRPWQYTGGSLVTSPSGFGLGLFARVESLKPTSNSLDRSFYEASFVPFCCSALKKNEVDATELKTFVRFLVNQQVFEHHRRHERLVAQLALSGRSAPKRGVSLAQRAISPPTSALRCEFGAWRTTPLQKKS